MHMPKRNLFAYICATLLGVVLLVLAGRGYFADLLGNLILVFMGLLMIAAGGVTIIRHIKGKREGK